MGVYETVRKTVAAVAAAISFGFASPAFAQDITVSAADPDGLVSLFEIAGYSPELSKDEYGDPLISIDVDGAKVAVYFYGCDEDTRTGCDSLQLSAGFDAPSGMTAAAALDLSRRFRFASVTLDEESDPFIRWDIITGSGIPAGVLLKSVRYFGDTLSDVSAIVFPDDEVTTTPAAEELAFAG